MSAVDIQELHVRLGQTDILKGLNLAVAEGEFLVLLGPSGCGKSTLLHTVAGLLDVADGRIAIGGRDVTYADPAQRGIGMVFQSYALYPTMTVERNLSFGLRSSGAPRAEVAQRVQQAATMLQLTELLQRKPAQFSGGQRQRVAIGRTLVRDASVYLFDEPLSNLDAKLRTELRRELKTLHRNIGKTMLYVTHDQVEAMTLATRIAVMRGGQILQIDTPRQLYDRPANKFVAGFVGSPAMNFIEGRLAHRDAGVQFEAPALAVALPDYSFAKPVADGQSATLGIRPEHIELTGTTTGMAQAEVGMVEPMGGVHVVWLTTESGASLAVEVSADAMAPDAASGRVGFNIDTGRVSLFDPATESRL